MPLGVSVLFVSLPRGSGKLRLFAPPPTAAVSSATIVSKPPLKTAQVSRMDPTTISMIGHGAGICFLRASGARGNEGKSQEKVSRLRALKSRQGGIFAGVNAPPHT